MIIDFLGHKVFRAGIATCIISLINKDISSNELKFYVENVINFADVKSVLGSDNPLNKFPENSVNTVELLQQTLNSSRWSISPYNHIFAIIDSQGVKLRDLPECDLVEQGIQTGETVFLHLLMVLVLNFLKIY